MDGYGYNPYASTFSPMRPPEPEYPDHGDGFGEYYSLEDRERRSRSKQKLPKRKDSKRSRSRSNSLQAKSRVLYLTPSKSGKQPSKFLATKKRQDRIQEILKSDGFGSKRWLFYPRVKNRTDSTAGPVAGTRDNIDQRVKVDAEFFRKYKKSKKVDNDAPIRKLKRWELIFYKKLGFIQAI
ncbi:hypothetical protein PYW07_001346 [Mythimna separata]|uniref:Uncharacterized protein n=1 Tax=Mythimna separata TaxID=271217 RepID=A0AAD7YS42_MYTSE|nr:hypothetical protein PYW07_001346 [Mythimna separata]